MTNPVIDMLRGFHHVMAEVALSLAPMLILFAFVQVFLLKLPKRRILNMTAGIMIAFAGLSLFLQGVKTGFSPAGEMLGSIIGKLELNWILVPVGLVLGFTVILAEPAVRILNDEIEKVTGGAIRKSIMLVALCAGVAVSVALSMLRVLSGFSLWYLIIPGYIAVFALAPFVRRDFTAIAFDSGGAATGPMTVTFILSMTVGAAKSIESRNPMTDGFGMVSMVALVPILSILILGMIYGRKFRQLEYKNRKK